MEINTKTNKILNLFLDAQIVEFDAAENTISAYRRDLIGYIDWLYKNKNSVLEVKRETIEDYIIACTKAGLAVSTRARKLSAIKKFYSFSYDENWITSNPTLKIKTPSRQKLLPKTLNSTPYPSSHKTILLVISVLTSRLRRDLGPGAECLGS